MTVHELYHPVCPVCLKSFSAVSKAAKYDCDKCRKKAYRRRVQLNSDGMLRGVPRRYDRALETIKVLSETAYAVLTDMVFCGMTAWAIKFSIIACYEMLGSLYQEGDLVEPVNFKYLGELRLDLYFRVDQEKEKLFQDEEKS